MQLLTNQESEWPKKVPKLSFVSRFLRWMRSYYFPFLTRFSISFIFTYLTFQIFKFFDKGFNFINFFMTLSWRRSLPFKNQFIDLLCKSVDWILYNGTSVMGKLGIYLSLCPILDFTVFINSQSLHHISYFNAKLYQKFEFLFISTK